MTAQDLKNMPENKIRTIATTVGAFGSAMQFKVMKDSGLFIVVTRQGLLEYLGNAQWAYIWGTKNKHYKEFKTAEAAINFIYK